MLKRELIKAVYMVRKLSGSEKKSLMNGMRK